MPLSNGKVIHNLCFKPDHYKKGRLEFSVRLIIDSIEYSNSISAGCLPQCLHLLLCEGLLHRNFQRHIFIKMCGGMQKMLKIKYDLILCPPAKWSRGRLYKRPGAQQNRTPQSVALQQSERTLYNCSCWTPNKSFILRWCIFA